MTQNLQIGIKSRLIGWSVFHAVIMLISAAIMLFAPFSSALAIGAAISFLALLAIGKKDWTPSGKFGLGNSITALRLTFAWLICYFGGSISPSIIFVLALLILMMDGIDGRAARLRNEVSDFGEFWDKETDAFLMLVLAMLIYLKALGPAWLLTMGALRYFFGIYIFLLKPSQRTERRSRLGRWIYVFSVAVLLSYFLPLPSWRNWMGGLAVLALLYSFGRDMLWMFREKFNC